MQSFYGGYTDYGNVRAFFPDKDALWRSSAVYDDFPDYVSCAADERIYDTVYCGGVCMPFECGLIQLPDCRILSVDSLLLIGKRTYRKLRLPVGYKLPSDCVAVYPGSAWKREALPAGGHCITI